MTEPRGCSTPRAGKKLRRFSGHTGRVVSAVFSIDDRAVLTASDDGTARLFDAASGKELRRFTGHEGGVYSAVFSADGRLVLTAAADGLRVFEAETGRCLRALRIYPKATAVCDGDGRVLSLSGEAWRYVYGLQERPGHCRSSSIPARCRWTSPSRCWGDRQSRARRLGRHASPALTL